jgi:hypothetical protein
MKIFRAVSILCVAAILVLGTSAGQSSAGELYGLGSCGACGGGGGYGSSGSTGCVYGGFVVLRCGGGAGGSGYGACGPGGCGGAGGFSSFWIVGDYFPYVIGHGPMFPAGDAAVGFSYTTYGGTVAPDMPIAPKPR